LHESDPSRPRPARVFAVSNQKGGVGKTTTAINLAHGLVEAGARVLLIDLDPQGNASTGLGLLAAQRKVTSYDVLLDEAPISEAIQETGIPGLYLCPANSDLSSADVQLVANEKRIFLLQDALRQRDIDQFAFDTVLIDCPPSLNLLTVNAMIAAHAVIVPLQAEFFALEGLSQLLLTIREIRRTGNPGLRLEGVLLTMFDRRNLLCQQVEADARGALGEVVFKTVIPRNVRVSESPSFAKSVLEYDPTSKGAQAYRALAREILQRNPIVGKDE
jgi:chromosome partitioning protein